ncbi:MAG: ABC transporter permease [SAR202 cluster bacterium]|nr:ABC transporter permease [SAR202 cluster bacterium]
MADQASQQPNPTVQDQQHEEYNVASQWKLMWWRFRKHKAAMISAVILGICYLAFPFSEFLGIGEPGRITEPYHYLRPQVIRFFDNGSFSPHVNGLRPYRDLKTFQKKYQTLPNLKYPVRLFASGYEYKMFGFINTNKHILGFSDPNVLTQDTTMPDGTVLPSRPSLFLLGSDSLGRDSWSRLVLSNRISLSIGMIGVAISLVGGIVMGGISGYYGGVVDTIIQRIIEIKGGIPTLPLWMGLSAAVPRDWTVLQVYFGITLVLSIFAWTGMARTVRGKFLALREEDYVMAARIAGAPEGRIMFRHMLPGFYSHIIASISLSIPGMIIGETSLSFLGLGLRPPAVSYGIMLIEAQNPVTVALYPWLMFVALPVIIIVLAFNFLGDGLRDASDPYGK